MESRLLIMVAVFCITTAKSVNKLNERSACPDVSDMCFNMDTSWCHATTKTHFYLEDGTKCKGCTECIPAPPKVECPVVMCAIWEIPMYCRNPRLVSFYTEYGGRECRACETFFCME